jgi:hypothetical protein
MKITATRKIKATTEALWNYLGDYANIYRFNPLISHSHFNEGATTCEVGSTRQCDMKTGDYLKERIIEWKEGSHYSVEIYETSMPLKKAVAKLGVIKIDAQTSEVFMEMEIVAKYAVLTPIMYLMFKFVAAPGILKGLEKLYLSESKIDLVGA